MGWDLSSYCRCVKAGERRLSAIYWTSSQNMLERINASHKTSSSVRFLNVISDYVTQSKSKNRVWLKVRHDDIMEEGTQCRKNGRWKWACIWGIFPPGLCVKIQAALIRVDEGRKRLGSLVELHAHTVQSTREYSWVQKSNYVLSRFGFHQQRDDTCMCVIEIVITLLSAVVSGWENTAGCFAFLTSHCSSWDPTWFLSLFGHIETRLRQWHLPECRWHERMLVIMASIMTAN